MGFSLQKFCETIVIFSSLVRDVLKYFCKERTKKIKGCVAKYRDITKYCSLVLHSSLLFLLEC